MLSAKVGGDIIAATGGARKVACLGDESLRADNIPGPADDREDYFAEHKAIRLVFRAYVYANAFCS